MGLILWRNAYNSAITSTAFMTFAPIIPDYGRKHNLLRYDGVTVQDTDHLPGCHGGGQG